MIGITGFGPEIDYMVMQSSQDADDVIDKVNELAAAGYSFSFEDILQQYQLRQSDFMPEDIRRIRRRVEEINQLNRSHD